MEERVSDRWSDDSILPVINYILNSQPCSENGKIEDDTSPFDLTFGNLDRKYFQINPASYEIKSKFISDLNENLKILREASVKFQNSIIESRKSDKITNLLQPGDFVLKKTSGPFKIGKLNPKYIGPFKVISHIKNDVEMRHLSNDHIETVNSEKLKIFFGSEEEAKNAALLDYNQYWLDSILSYLGNPEKRSTLRFKVKYADGDICWVPYCSDLSTTKQFDDFCSSKIELRVLFLNSYEADKHIRDMNNRAICNINIGDIFYFNINWLGTDWYENLKLPDYDSVIYVVRALVIKKISSKKFLIHMPVFDTARVKYTLEKKAYWFYAYCNLKEEFVQSNPDMYRIVDKGLVGLYPQIMKY